MSTPDWMNFGDDVDTIGAAAPLPATNAVVSPPIQDDHFASPPTSHAAHHHDNEDIPLFLREDAAALRGASAASTNNTATPAFLTGMGGPDMAEDHASSLQVEATSEAVRRRPATADQSGKEAHGAAMYADQPSAALLHFCGDSGTTWSLHRVRILGKGNYGCATLYSLDEEATEQASPHHQQQLQQYQPSPRRAVVVKDINVQTMLNPHEEMPAVQNELNVLRSAAGHPNLVQYVDALFDSRPVNYPMCFILMEYAAGGDLAALLERCSTGTASPSTSSSPSAAAVTQVRMTAGNGGSVSANMIAEEYIAAYLIQTAVALHSLHTEHGILHRDVKPHNIFLLEDGLTVRLGDFGISMRLGRIGEKAKEACGSPYFMAPEIFEEKPYDSAADVWSLGVVFYQLLTHELPFTASSVTALGAIVRRGQFTRLADTTAASLEESSASKAAIYSKELRELVDSLLTVEPSARPTLRRVLRGRYVREHLHCVPVSVLQARRPVVHPHTPKSCAALEKVTSTSSSPLSGAAAATAIVAPQFEEESLYASVFGADAVAAAVAHASNAGVTPIVNRVQSA